MEKLMDDDDPMDIDRAETIGKVAQVIVNSAKVEVDFIKQTGHGGTSFIQAGHTPPAKQLAAVPPAPIEVTPDARPEDLCQSCQLPDCNEESDRCLVKIQRQQRAAA